MNPLSPSSFLSLPLPASSVATKTVHRLLCTLSILPPLYLPRLSDRASRPPLCWLPILSGTSACRESDLNSPAHPRLTPFITACVRHSMNALVHGMGISREGLASAGGYNSWTCDGDDRGAAILSHPRRQASSMHTLFIIIII